MRSLSARSQSAAASPARPFTGIFFDKYDLINWYFDKLLARSFEHMGRGTTVLDSLEKKFTYIQEEKTFLPPHSAMTGRIPAGA